MSEMMSDKCDMMWFVQSCIQPFFGSVCGAITSMPCAASATEELMAGQRRRCHLCAAVVGGRCRIVMRSGWWVRALAPGRHVAFLERSLSPAGQKMLCQLRALRFAAGRR